jgi:hypothetical protein
LSEKLHEKLRLPKTIFDNPSGMLVAVKEDDKFYDPLLVLGEACPGNVTTRFNSRGDFEWVPIVVDVRGLMDCGRIFTFWERESLSKPINFFRDREKRILSIWHQDEEEITILKLKKVHVLEKFADAGRRMSNDWGYCKDCSVIDKRSKHWNHKFVNLRVDTESYPLLIKYIEPSTEGRQVRFPIWFEELSPKITFYDEYMKKVTLYEGTMGVTATFKLFKESSNLHGVYGFQWRNKPAAVGYQYDTEGFKFSLNRSKLKEKIYNFVKNYKDDIICRDLYIKFLIYKLSYDLLREKLSIFDAELISKFLITKLTFNLSKDIDETVRDTYFSRIHPVAKEKIINFMETEKFGDIEDYMRISLEGKMDEDNAFIDHLVYTFMHSLSHVFLAAFCSCSGINENEVGEYIKVDGDDACFYIYERPLNGATRIIHRNIMHLPGTGRIIDFLHYIESGLLSCPVSMAEDFICDVIFKTPGERIKEVRKLFDKLQNHGISINEFITHLTNVLQCCIPAKNAVLEKLRKVFRKSLIKGEEIDEFKLHFDVYLLSSYLQGKLRREPFLDEFVWLVENFDNMVNDILSYVNTLGFDILSNITPFKELSKLRSLLRDEKIFLEELQKRYLRSCVDGCPSCIGSVCGDEIWGLSKYTLSRRLLQNLAVNTIENSALTFPRDAVDDSFITNIFNKLSKGRSIFLLSPHTHVEQMLRFIDLSIQKGGNIRDFQVVKTNNSYKYLALIVM